MNKQTIIGIVIVIAAVIGLVFAVIAGSHITPPSVITVPPPDATSTPPVATTTPPVAVTGTTITWTASAIPESKVQLAVMLQTGINPIAYTLVDKISNIPNTGTYAWTATDAEKDAQIYLEIGCMPGGTEACRALPLFGPFFIPRAPVSYVVHTDF